MKTTLFSIIAILLLAGCQPKSAKVSYEVDPNNREVVVKESLSASSYTYLLVSENGKEYWMAVGASDFKIGGTYYYSDFMEMVDFHSKDLDRTFERVLFVENLSENPIPASGADNHEGHSHDGDNHDGHDHGDQLGEESMGKPIVDKIDIKIDAVEGAITIAELGTNKDKYSNKAIKVAGKVVKYNPGIMGVNWVHIQDGTAADSFYDLTVTTLDEVAVGDIVVFEGKLTLKKDFGSGYFYEIIMEEAKATVKHIH